MGKNSMFAHAIMFIVVTSLATFVGTYDDVSGHEFWINLEKGIVEPGDEILGDLQVGQMLQGTSYPYLSNRFRRFAVTGGGRTDVVSGSEGDMPALVSTARAPGLTIIAHQTVPFRVAHDDWAGFERYLRDEGLASIREKHLARGLPRGGFSERYTRYAKALVQVGLPGTNHRDKPVGMPLELVLDENPYGARPGTIGVRLLWMGRPVAGAQITRYVSGIPACRSTAVTDETGSARFDLREAGHYLLNAVLMHEPADNRVAWESHWASLSFRLHRAIDARSADASVSDHPVTDEK